MPARPHLLQAAAVGVAAGLVGAWTMELWQTNASELRQAAAEARGDESEAQIPSTEKAADAVSRVVRGRRVSDDGREEAGRLVHYSTGAALGAAYAVVAELWDEAAAGFGLGLVLSSWLALDEGAVPALGLGPPPQRTSPGDHVYGFGAHLVFGVATEGARRVLRGR